MHELNHQCGKGDANRSCSRAYRDNFPDTLALVEPDGFVTVRPGRSRKTYPVKRVNQEYPLRGMDDV